MSREHVLRSGLPPALRVLRDGTRAAHAGLDAGLTGHGRRVADETSYLTLLRVLAELHAVTEPPLHAWVATTPWLRAALGDVPVPSRAALYAEDLAALGADAARRPLPVQVYDDARGLASLYLLAGSAKGARVLLRGLPDHVAPDARSGLADAASRDSARLWGAVVHALGAPLERAHVDTHLDLAAAAAGHAADVFAALHGLVGVGRTVMAG